jgi:plastocyanin
VAARKLTAVAALVALGAVTPATLAAGETPGPAAAVEATSSGARIGTGSPAGDGAAMVRISTAGADPAERRAEASAAALTVAMGDYFFRPTDVTISAGEAVRWTNEGKVREGHTATGDGFDSGVLEQGQSYTHTFANEGSFDYVCTLHPSMKGTVTVTAAEESGTGGGGTTNSGSGGLGNAPGGASTTPSGATGGAGAGSGSSGDSLPSTGLNLILLAEIGMCLLSGGALVRRLLRA